MDFKNKKHEYLFENFRDVADFNPVFRHGKIFRTSCLVKHQFEDSFIQMLKQYKISAIVDLRFNAEIETEQYDLDILEKHGIRYLNLPMEIPKAKDFLDSYSNASLRIVEYCWFAFGNKLNYKDFFSKLNPINDTILIHCISGKDRTGAFVALLAMLCDEIKTNIETDYLESKKNSDINCIDAFMETVNKEGGAEKFLLSCGIEQERLSFWKKELKK